MKDTETIEMYDLLAEKYETRWRTYLNHTHSMLLHHLSTDANDRILDPSCGTGLLAQKIIQTGFPYQSLALNDPSEKMLAAARNRLPDDLPISFTHHSADSIPLKGPRFTMILCLNAFHNYSDQKKVIGRFHDLLDPGGTLYILDWNREGFFRFINTFIRWYVPGTINTRSAAEMENLIHSNHFDLLKLDTWRFRYWNFYFLKAAKINS